MQVARGAQDTVQRQADVPESSSAHGAITKALLPLELTQFDALQADTLQRLRNACLGVADWSDAPDGPNVVTVGQAYAEATSASATGAVWPWPGVLFGGHALIWAAAQEVLAQLAGALEVLRTDSSALRAGAVCKTLTDAAALWQCLVLRPSELAQSAKRSLLHINTLFHLAAETALLPLGLTHACPHRAAVVAAAADAAATFEELAAEKQALFVANSGDAVAHILQGVPQLTAMDRRGGLAARKQAQKASTALRSLAEAVSRACAPERQVIVFAGILGRTVAPVAARILALPDISPADCDEICAVFEGIWSDVPAAAAKQFQRSSGASGESQWPPAWHSDAICDAIKHACLPLRKLEAIGRLLKDRMAEIMPAWERGELQAAGLSANEVAGVLRSVFEDNALQRSNIATLEAASGAGGAAA